MKTKQGTNMQDKRYNIFISYRREDGAQYARIIQLLLENEGYSVFLDYEELKDGKFESKIENAIIESQVFILILSRKYFSRCWKRNDWVRKEISIAIKNRKKIIPVVPDNIDVKIPFFLDKELSSFILEEQFSHIDFGEKLYKDVRSMIKGRIDMNVIKDIDVILPQMPYDNILSVILDKKTHPVNFVDINSDGCVNLPFTALVIGFKEIGLEYFKFLYEFGTFINHDSEKTPFRCYAIDENIDQISGYLNLDMPAITNEELTLIKTQIGSEKYIKTISTIINDLNYIVITLDDVNMAMYHAIQICKLCLKYRKRSSRLGIFVRSNRMSYQVLSEFNTKSEDAIEIYPFILDKQDAKYKQEILEKAKEFHCIYNCIYENSELSANDLWEKHFRNNNIGTLMERRNISQYDAIYDINRRIAHNISNVLHMHTKMVLMGFYSNTRDNRLKEYNEYATNREPMTTEYICDEDDKQLLLNIAIVEHERWIASQKLMGYTYNTENDYVKKYHKDMCAWNELDDKTKSFDCNVVDTTIKMVYKEIKNIFDK